VSKTDAQIHPTAIIDDGVSVGSGTAIWDTVHLRNGVRVGRDCIIGEKTYIAPDVVVGNRCKINGFVYVCRGVTIEDGVMVGANVTFTNDRFPRATTPELDALRPSDLEDETLRTLVREGATIGAGATIGNDLVVGRFAMIGMGAVVTRPVPDFALVAGNPARSLGYVCRCGTPVHRGGRGTAMPATCTCSSCGRRYERDTTGGLREPTASG
jgi:UDP-2-acetamido-3-amino-2,3-dideoxy-glucuronate N-acetyltransferase